MAEEQNSFNDNDEKILEAIARIESADQLTTRTIDDDVSMKTQEAAEATTIIPSEEINTAEEPIVAEKEALLTAAKEDANEATLAAVEERSSEVMSTPHPASTRAHRAMSMPTPYTKKSEVLANLYGELNEVRAQRDQLEVRCAKLSSNLDIALELRQAGVSIDQIREAFLEKNKKKDDEEPKDKTEDIVAAVDNEETAALAATQEVVEDQGETAALAATQEVVDNEETTALAATQEVVEEEEDKRQASREKEEEEVSFFESVSLRESGAGPSKKSDDYSSRAEVLLAQQQRAQETALALQDAEEVRRSSLRRPPAPPPPQAGSMSTQGLLARFTNLFGCSCAEEPPQDFVDDAVHEGDGKDETKDPESQRRQDKSKRAKAKARQSANFMPYETPGDLAEETKDDNFKQPP